MPKFQSLFYGALLLALNLTACAGFSENGNSNGVIGESSNTPAPVTAAQPTTPLPPDQTLKKRVLILPFENATEFPQEALQDAVMAELKTAVSANPQLSMVDLDTFAPPELLAPVRLGKPSQKQLEIAHLVGADAVITGTLKEMQVRQQADEIGLLGSKRFEARARIFMRVTDVVTHKELFGRDFVATATEERIESLERSLSAQTELGKSAVIKSLRSLATGISQVSGRIAWSGRIARIDYQRYYINGGRKSGVFPGLLLKVFSPSNDISDRTTGQSLGIAPGRFKGYLKVMENFGDDASLAILHLGAGFHEEDIVEPHFPDQN